MELWPCDYFALLRTSGSSSRFVPAPSPRSRRSSTAITAACSGSAVTCSPPPTRPRTRCSRRSCRPIGTWSGRIARSGCGRGCTRSPVTAASRSCDRDASSTAGRSGRARDGESLGGGAAARGAARAAARSRAAAGRPARGARARRARRRLPRGDRGSARLSAGEGEGARVPGPQRSDPPAASRARRRARRSASSSRCCGAARCVATRCAATCATARGAGPTGLSCASSGVRWRWSCRWRRRSGSRAP